MTATTGDTSTRMNWRTVTSRPLRGAPSSFNAPVSARHPCVSNAQLSSPYALTLVGARAGTGRWGYVASTQLGGFVEAGRPEIWVKPVASYLVAGVALPEELTMPSPRAAKQTT
jgi:hypothetical protein